MTGDRVVGVDAGGTRTRCAVVDLEGTLVARGEAPGANPNSSPDPEGALDVALGEALREVAPHRVRAGAVGLAGAASNPRGDAAVRRVWSGLGLAGTPTVYDDILVAFASATREPEGTVLISGTGAVGARVRSGAVVRRCDGNGWLLGDEGSAVWIAVAGLRAVLAAWDGRGPGTGLCELLPAELQVPARDPRPLRGAVYARAPAELGRLAPAVSQAAEAGDAVAGAIVQDAARRLLSSLEILAPDPREPVVLAGSVLEAGPVAEAVRRGVRERLGAWPLPAGDGALGAAALALCQEAPSPSADAPLLASQPMVCG